MNDTGRSTALIFSLIFIVHVLALYPLLTKQNLDGWDNAVHYSVCLQTEEILIKDPANFLDGWYDAWNLGFPLLQYYQHAPYLLMALLHRALFFIPWSLFYNISIFVLLACFPLTIYKGTRAMGFDRDQALWAAVLCNLIQSSCLFAMDPDSYLRVGVYTQLWGAFFFPLAYGYSVRAIREGRSYGPAVLFAALTSVSHALMGAMLLMILLTVPFAVRRETPRLLTAAGRLALLYLLILLSVLYWLLPMSLNGYFMTPEPWMDNSIRNSYGFGPIVIGFLQGRLLDHQRIAVMTFLVIAGIFIGIKRPSQGSAHVLIGLAASLVLFAGSRGPAGVLKMLPFTHYIPLERFIFLFDFFCLLACAIGAAAILRWLRARRSILPVAAFLALFAAYPLLNFIPECHMRISAILNYEADTAFRESFLDACSRLSRFPDARVYTRGKRQFSLHYISALVPDLSGKPALCGYSAAAGSLSLGFYYAQLMNTADSDHLNLFNVRYLLSESRKGEERAWPKEVYRNNVFHIKEAKTTGFFDLVQVRCTVAGDRIDLRGLSLAWMRGPWLAEKHFLKIVSPGEPSGSTPHLEVRTSRDVKAFNIPSRLNWDESAPLDIFGGLPEEFEEPAAPRGEILDQQRGMSSYTARVRVNQDCHLILKVNYHPQWSVFVDGREVRADMISPCFPGVFLTKGVHDVQFRFTVLSLKKYLFIAAVLLVLALFRIEKSQSLRTCFPR